MPAELPESFDCLATAAVLRSGRGLSFASHASALLVVLPLSRGGIAYWVGFASLPVWCVAIYFAIRVAVDVQFFELLASHPPEQLDTWLAASGLRKAAAPRSLTERRNGALRWWRILVGAVSLQIALTLLAILMLLG